MSTLQEQRLAYYEKLPEHLKPLYDHFSTAIEIRKIFDMYGLRTELFPEYSLAFGDVVLGLEEESHMPQLLIERIRLPEKMATLIAHDLLEFLNENKSHHQSTQMIDPSTPVHDTSKIEVAKPKVDFSVFQKREPGREPLPQNEAPATPAWSRFVEQHPTPQKTSLQTKASEAEVVPGSEHETPIPSYARPLTNTPRYQEDPYREKPE